MGIKSKIRLIIKKIVRLLQREKKVPIYIPILKGSMLENKTVLITGGAGGIGIAIAYGCLMNGADIILAGRNENKLLDAREYLCKNSCNEDNVSILVLDITKTGEIKKKLEEACQKTNNKKIDILINNAGVAAGDSIGQTSEFDYDKTLSTNLKGTYFLSQEFSNYLIENKIQGNILNVSSASGIRPAITPYMISKWGITGLTEGLAKKLIKNDIVVNGIAPGPTATDMLNLDGTDLMYNNSPAKRYADPVEIANLAVFLISSLGRMIIGETVYITGGCGTLTLDDIEY